MTLSSFKYPLEIDTDTGSLKMSIDESVKQNNIRCLIETVIGERIFRPDYGTPIYLFEIVNNPNLIKYKIEQIILKYVSNVSLKIESRINANGELLIIIYWSYLLKPNVNQIPINLNLGQLNNP